MRKVCFNNIKISETIKNNIENCGIEKNQLIKSVNITMKRCDEILNGDITPSIEELIIFANLFKISIDDILFYTIMTI